jgi:uncharacterized membrane protein (DUF373 family)
MEKLVFKFEKFISYFLLILAGIFIIFETMELLWTTYDVMYKRFEGGKGFVHVPYAGLSVMVVFFNILMMLEIMQTIKVFNKGLTVKLRVILLVCLIAVSRKIFLLDVEHDAMLEFSTAALIFAIALGYYFISRSELMNKLNHDGEE